MITSNNNKMIVQVDPEASTNLVQKLALMQESGELCDYIIIVSGLEIKAHKCVLASCCDYFKTSFSFSESSQFSTEMDLTHLGCEVKVVENVIKSFYTNQIALDPNCLEGVLQLVDYFMCESLRLCIETFMESMLSFHTAVCYFQMALQYRLNLTGLFNSAKWLLWFHFHDYFIYQYDTLESSMDNINAYMTYDIFCHCNPLQLVEFMLKNVVNAVERLHTSGTYTKTDLPKVVHERVESTFQKLSVLLDKVRPDVLETWKPRLVNYLKTWKERNLPESEYFSELICHVRSLEIWLSDEEFNIDSLCSKKHKCHVCYRKFLISKSSKMKPEDISNFSQIVCTNQNCQSKNNPGMQDPNIGVIWTFRNEFEPDDDEYKARRDYCVCTPKPIRDYLISFDKTDSENRMLPSWLKPNEHEVQESLTIKNKPQTTSLTRQNHNMSSCGITTAEAIKEMDNLSSDIDQNSIIDCHHPSEAVSSNQKEFTELTPSVLLNPRHMDTQELQCNILVVLAPSVEMATELMAVDDGQVRPLLKSPKLELSYYDIEANTWCKGCKLDFPIQGAMLEKHSWRIAYLDGCLYMFSLGRQVGLQYNIQESTWRYLDCQQLFTRHGDNSPVKSVIPIKVGED